MKVVVLVSLVLVVVLASVLFVYADEVSESEVRGTHTADEIIVSFQGKDTTLHAALDTLNTLVATATMGIPQGFVETPTNLNEDVYGSVAAVAATVRDTCDTNKGRFFGNLAAKGIQDYGRYACPADKETPAGGCDDVFLTGLYTNTAGRIVVSPQYASRKVFCAKAFSLVKTTQAQPPVPMVP